MPFTHSAWSGATGPFCDSATLFFLSFLSALETIYIYKIIYIYINNITILYINDISLSLFCYNYNTVDIFPGSFSQRNRMK